MKMEHVRTFSSEEGLPMTWLHGIKTYRTRFLGGLGSRLGPPEQRAGCLRLRRRIGRGRVRRRQRRRVLGEGVGRAALAGAVLPVAGDGGEVRAEANAHRPLGLPPHPLHERRHSADSRLQASHRRLLPPSDLLAVLGRGEGCEERAVVLKGGGSRHWRARRAVECVLLLV